MSSRAHGLVECLRDLATAADGDEADRDAVGRDVLLALAEIDRATTAPTRAPGAALNAVGAVSAPVQLNASPGAQTVALLRAASSVTDVCRAPARSAATVLGAGVSIRATGRQVHRG